jgi:glutamine amidotransferase
MISIIDYGMGNLLSVRKAFEYLGEDVRVIDDPKGLSDASHVVLPGVGAFPDAMAALNRRGWADTLQREVVEGGKPFLGICLGMQLLAEFGEENFHCPGLGWIRGSVKRFMLDQRQFKVPHVGWNEIKPIAGVPLFKGVGLGSTFYFVHSYHLICADEADIAAYCDYGYPFAAAIRRGNIFATQFHPEKSQDNGIKVLENFLAYRGA